MISGGSVILNGVTEADLIKILEIKAKSGDNMSFAPQNLQPIQSGPTGPQKWNNCNLGFVGSNQLAVVIDILQALKKE